MNNIYKIICVLLFLTIVIAGFFSCTDETPVRKEGGLPGSEAYMKIELNIPDYKIPTDSMKKTKAMDNVAEKAIKSDLLSILVFKTNDKFYYKAPVSDLTIESSGKATATIKLVKSKNNEKCNIVVIANHNMSSVSMSEDITTKNDILEQLKYTISTSDRKWNAATGSSTPFPMWAELGDITVTENMLPIELNLYRALARVDVGLAFKIGSDGTLTEEVLGLDHFKLQEVKVYRTYGQGHVVPLKADYTETPTIPSGSTRYADDKPLSYTAGSPVDSYLREIYLPEADLPETPSNENMHCIVIGGYYRGATDISYYRLDFAEITNSSPIDYYPILRNHRYVFNILNVIGPGFASPEQALKSTSSGSSVEYELIVWNESIHEMHVEGKYYFGLDNRDLIFGPKKTIEDATNVHIIKYQTNYPLAPENVMTFEWESVKNGEQPIFEVEHLEADQSIKITTLTTNDTNIILTDVLYVKLGPFTIKVNIQQKFINFNYIINCEDVKVFGTYGNGRTLNSTHYITLSITAEDTSLNGMDYIIETDPINGIVFKASGTFSITESNKTVSNIKLQGEGTLTISSAGKTDPFTVKIVSNSSLGAYCEATITPVISKLTILTLGNTANHGYDIGRKGMGSYKVIKHPNNFGPNNNSIVKIEGLDLIQGGQCFSSFNNEVLKWLRDGYDENGIKRLADILYVGHDALYSVGADHAKIIVDYMKMGGVVLMFNEGNMIGPLVEQLFKTESYETSRIDGLSAFPFVGNEVFKTTFSNNDWNEYLLKLQSDPILNGPFGDIKDKQWGEDASRLIAINTPILYTDPNVMIYSYGQTLANARNGVQKNSVAFFKYETDKDATEPISLVYNGDGGFVSSGYRLNSSYPHGYEGVLGTLPGITPFWWDENTFFPIPKPDYNQDARVDVYNSQAFCNILAWAINRSLDLQAKRDAAMSGK